MSGTAGEDFAQHICDLLAPAGGLSLRRYFGGWALRRGGQQVGMVMDTLYLRVNRDTAEAWQERGSHPFEYRSGTRTVQVLRYRSVPVDLLDDADELCDVVRHHLAGPG